MTPTATLLTIGSAVTCQDGPGGVLRKLVVDPLAGTVTHLVVQLHHEEAGGRLVPVGLLSTGTSDLRLTCTAADLGLMEPAQDERFLPGTPQWWGYPSEQLVSWPYYGLDAPGPSRAGRQVVLQDHIPLGEVEVRRGDRVHAEDGSIGRIGGLIVDVDDRRISHVLLAEGHLWGHKTVAIPFRLVSSIADGIAVALTKEQVRELPPVDFYQFT